MVLGKELTLIIFKNTGPHCGQLKCDVIFNGPFKTCMEWSKESLIIFESTGMNASKTRACNTYFYKY